MELPVLYSKTKLGGIQEWKVWTEGADVVSEYGRLRGAKQIARYRAVATNVGRSNERSASEQAESEAKSMWQKRLDKKYATSVEAAKEPLFLPMLAKDFKTEKKVTYPVDVQPKLDGVRCIAFWDGDDITLMSRGGKCYYVPHVSDDLEKILPKNDTFDGELYVYGLNCQTITSYVKKNKPESVRVKYWVYDIPVAGGKEDLPWEERRYNLEELAKNMIPGDVNPEEARDVLMPFPSKYHIVAVPTFAAESATEVYKYQSRFLSRGFEGAIVRTLSGLYQWGYRSHDLLKVKDFKDAEFKVIGCEEGKGKFEGCAVWVCETDEGKKFSCTPMGTFEKRQEYWRNRKDYIGKMLTVKYFEMTGDNIPRFPVGLHFRADEDLPNG